MALYSKVNVRTASVCKLELSGYPFAPPEQSHVAVLVGRCYVWSCFQGSLGGKAKRKKPFQGKKPVASHNFASPYLSNVDWI